MKRLRQETVTVRRRPKTVHVCECILAYASVVDNDWRTAAASYETQLLSFTPPFTPPFTCMLYAFEKMAISDVDLCLSLPSSSLEMLIDISNKQGSSSRVLSSCLHKAMQKQEGSDPECFPGVGDAQSMDEETPEVHYSCLIYQNSILSLCIAIN